VRSDLAVETQAVLARAGITVPFPQRVVQLTSAASES